MPALTTTLILVDTAVKYQYWLILLRAQVGAVCSEDTGEVPQVYGGICGLCHRRRRRRRRRG